MSGDLGPLNFDVDSIVFREGFVPSRKSMSDLEGVVRKSFEADFREAICVDTSKISLSKKNVIKGNQIGTGCLSDLISKTATLACRFLKIRSVVSSQKIVDIDKAHFITLLNKLSSSEKFKLIMNKIDLLFNGIHNLDPTKESELNHKVDLLYDECKFDIAYCGSNIEEAISEIDKRIDNFSRLNGYEIKYKSLLIENGISIKESDFILAIFKNPKIGNKEKHNLFNAVESALQRRNIFTNELIGAMMSCSTENMNKVLGVALQNTKVYDDELGEDLSVLSTGPLKKSLNKLEDSLRNLASPKLFDVVEIAYKEISSDPEKKAEVLKNLSNNKNFSFLDHVKAFMAFRDSSKISGV